jgi:hypothetical protein
VVEAEFVCVLVPAFAAAVAVLALAIGRWIFNPVERAARRRELPPQYSIADFLCLFFLIQLPMALVHGYLGGTESRGPGSELARAAPWVLDVFAWFACGMMWWLSIRTLSRAGIRNPWSRAIFLVVVVPVALVGALGIPMLSIAVLIGLHSWTPAPWIWWALVLLDLVFVGAVFGCGKYTRRIVAAAGAPGEAEKPPPRVRPASAAEAGGNPFRAVSEEAKSGRAP